MAERNRMVENLQAFAVRRRIRVTFASGDVHIGGVGRFRAGENELPEQNGEEVARDPYCIYQLISSAIGNRKFHFY
jgi:hypothetical protein